MNDLLQHLRPTELILIGVAIGQWINARARRDQGRRIGSLAAQFAALRGQLNLPPPPGGGDAG